MEPSVLLAGLGKASLAGASLLLSSTSHSCTLESLWPIRTHISDMGARSFTRNLVRAITFALVRGVVRRKKAALVLPPLAGEPGSMMSPGLSWARREAMFWLLSIIKQSSVLVAEMNLPYFL